MWWRVESPAEVIGAKTVLMPEKEAGDMLQYPNLDTVFPWTMTAFMLDGTTRRILSRSGWNRFAKVKTAKRFTKLVAEFPKHEGVAIFVRPSYPQAVLAQAMRWEGIKTVAETDDNYFAKRDQNLFMRQQQITEAQYLQHAKSFMQQDACVFSTKVLRDRYAEEFRKRFGKKGTPELHICRNHIPYSAWPERIEGNGRVRVGFMGSPSHVWDVNIAFASFKAAKDFGAETYMIGYNPGDPDPDVPETYTSSETGEIYQIKDPKSIEVSKTWKKVIDRHIQWITPAEYHRVALPLDIGLCPLLSNDFTLGKSDVKAIEYTISGAAVVCTNNPVYNEFWKHEENCLMANSYKEMAEATVRLIKDHKLRYELVTAAQEKVASERGIEQMRAEWQAVLN